MLRGNDMKQTILVSGLALALVLPQTASANNHSSDAIGAMMGAIIGSALSQGLQAAPQQNFTGSSAPSRSYAPSRSPAEIAEVREMQEALNYFNFPAGRPDGVIGRGTRSAIAQYQSFIGYPATGELLAHERMFLVTSFNRAAGEPPARIQQALANPIGLRSLLREYSQPEEPAVVDAGKNATQPTVVSSTVIVATANSPEMEELQDEVDDLADQVALLQAVVDHQRNSVASVDPEGAEARIEAVMALMETYSARLEEVETFSNEQYSTPIRPQNQNLGATARRLSEIFPKVPFYIAGTEETGEMWVEPEVTDQGYLVFGFNFIDPMAEYDQIRETISFTANEVEIVSASLTKVDEWTDVAQENGVRRNFERLVNCIPDGACENLQEGVSSSAVVFQIYEDGSTAAKIQRNRGLFVSSYNFSVESGLMLSAYLDYMREVGMREFTTGTMTEDDLDSLFE
jgi:peptidoglycan hydrolase-like protein with peptidoglycan-binding domain